MAMRFTTKFNYQNHKTFSLCFQLCVLRPYVVFVVNIFLRKIIPAIAIQQQLSSNSRDRLDGVLKRLSSWPAL
jgi:hypothetical protein